MRVRVRVSASGPVRGRGRARCEVRGYGAVPAAVSERVRARVSGQGAWMGVDGRWLRPLAEFSVDLRLPSSWPPGPFIGEKREMQNANEKWPYSEGFSIFAAHARRDSVNTRHFRNVTG